MYTDLYLVSCTSSLAYDLILVILVYRDVTEGWLQMNSQCGEMFVLRRIVLPVAVIRRTRPS